MIAASGVLGVIGFGLFVSSRYGLRAFLEGFQFELSDAKITQRRVSHPTVEIPLAQIESLHAFQDWLVIKTGDPLQEISIPSAVSGFEELKQELSVYRPIEPLKTVSGIYAALFQLILVVGACVFLFGSHNRSIILAAGSPILLIEGLMLHAIWRRRRRVLRPTLLLALYAMMLVLTAWTVYERSKGAW